MKIFIDYTSRYAHCISDNKMQNENTPRVHIFFFNEISMPEIITILYFISIHRSAPLHPYLNDIKWENHWRARSIDYACEALVPVFSIPFRKALPL